MNDFFLDFEWLPTDILLLTRCLWQSLPRKLACVGLHTPMLTSGCFSSGLMQETSTIAAHLKHVHVKSTSFEANLKEIEPIFHFREENHLFFSMTQKIF
jgi:hypothetical protein